MRRRRSESSSICCLISFSVRIPGKTRDDPKVFLGVAELVEAVLVDPEIVGELVEDGHADLLLELRGVRERLDERPSKDGDLVRQVRVRLPESEQVGVLRVGLGDDDGDVLERRRELRRQRVERPADVILEGHQRARSGARTWNSRTASAPNRTPPTWAPNATPPPCPGCVSEKPPCQSSNTNQIPRKMTAEIGRGRNPKSSVITRAWGSSTKYAPSTPAIAPLAPTVGTLAAPMPAKWSVTSVWTSAAT